MKRVSLFLLVLSLVLAFCACAAAGGGESSGGDEGSADQEVEVSKLKVKGFGPIQEIDYLIRRGRGDLVVLGVDGGWAPERSIVYQEALSEFNILYMRPAASNTAYLPYRKNAVSEVYKPHQRNFAKQVVPLLNEKFPTQRVVLFGHSRGGWYLDELYRELKAAGRTVVFAWCSDACPGDERSIYGFPEIEKDAVPIYVATSSAGGGKIVQRTRDYAQSGISDIVFSKKYDCNHSMLSIAAAEDFRDALLRCIGP